jgi:RNA-directed DNA polymerase
MVKFGLELRGEKTRLLRFGRFAASKGAKDGTGKPETFDFLDFTHICGRSSTGISWWSGIPCASGSEPNLERSRRSCNPTDINR